MKTAFTAPSEFDQMKFVCLPASLRARLSARTHELATKAGRSSSEITQRDYEEAKRELTGEIDPDRQNAALDAISPVPHRQERASTPASASIPFAPLRWRNERGGLDPMSSGTRRSHTGSQPPIKPP